MLRLVSVLTVTLLLLPWHGQTASIQHVQLLRRVLAAVEASLGFFTEDYSSINVDGLFGLRLGQGQLLEAIRECELRSCDETMLEKLRSLEHELDTACDAALPYVKNDDEVYYERFASSIEKPYILPYVPTEFDDQRGEIRKLGSHRIYSEHKGDDCYVRILGTYKEDGRTLPRCNITRACWDYMTKEGTAGYFITHQLLYFIMVEHVGCREEVENFIQGESLFAVYKRMCDDIYNEARSYAKRGDVISRRKDLFLEQTVLCGPLGFEDFLRPDWIEMVLRWPDRRLGCFKTTATSFDFEMLKMGQMNQKQQMAEDIAMMKANGFTIPANIGTVRQLLREKPMKDGCLAHTSGLGFGVLNTYLRFLLRYL